MLWPCRLVLEMVRFEIARCSANSALPLPCQPPMLLSSLGDYSVHVLVAISHPASGNPHHRHHGRDEDDEHDQPTDAAQKNCGGEEHDHSNATGDQTYAGRTRKQTYEDAVPHATGPVAINHSDPDWDQEYQPENGN